MLQERVRWHYEAVEGTARDVGNSEISPEIKIRSGVKPLDTN